MPYDPVGYVETKIVDADGDAAVRERAAQLIEKHGWAHGCRARNPAGSLCIMLAIGAADRYCDAAKVAGFPSLQEGWAWNDAPGRTKAEVIARLRSAAEQRA